MSETRWLNAKELDAWRNIVGLVLFLPTRLEEALQRNGLNFFEYSTLAALSDAPDQTIQMSSLADLANGSLSRLSHAAKRLENRGWIERHTSPSDRRVTLATLTKEGMAKLVEVAPSHVESVRQAVFDTLTPQQVLELGAICGMVVQNINPGWPPWEQKET
ncbi:MAG: MarR family transcriptional regulator [Acidimicrobiia bacterium]|nr:MarR family transcriptional regulator [Acidimicrobiia bacterium]MDH5422022.1 MarR family transcriptional regulator [Acidimicrobiia bacterium]MDH5503689.1 MarR family transcriptional regulator [Acidimicrobiia bacterium]